MLNRLYILIGVLAIVALAAAFVVPSFIAWGDYRDRLAQIAGEVLGTPVRIEGNVQFSLLPQPKLEFSQVSAGPPDAPNLVVDSVEAEFSLIDFLRDRYTLTRLALEGPRVEINVGSDGTVNAGVALPQSVSTSNISVANATIVGGQIRISDNRSGDAYLATNISGEVRLDALRGPFSFLGSGSVDGADYNLRLTTSALDADGTATLSANLRPTDGKYALSLEGTLQPGLMPAFSGTMAYRQAPAAPAEGQDKDAGQGDLVITSRVEASPSKVLLGDYTVIPDENRPATRLLGAADLSLGTNKRFNAVISGGLLALPPRDATSEKSVEPYELLRLLRELPIPAAPPLPGTIGIDIAELNLRAFSLRNVRLDARAVAGAWEVEQFVGDLPGPSKLTLAGRLGTDTGHAEFSGNVSVTSPRLDLLSSLWRKPADGNPLFNMGGALAARADLVGETLSLSDASFTIDGETRTFSAQLGLGTTRDIHLTIDLGSFTPARSAALFALLPDPRQDAQFAATFPSGEFDLRADALTVDGLDGKGLAAVGSWDGGVLVLDRLSAEDIGGAAFNASATAFGSFDKPELSGSGTLKIADAEAPAVARFFDTVATPPAVRAALARSFPADLTLKLGAPSGAGAQTLALTGQLGPSTVDAGADLTAGFLRALSGALKLRVDLKSSRPAEMSAQLGLGDEGLFPEEQPMHMAAIIEGDVGSSLTVTARADGGGDSIGFSGNLVVTDPDRFAGKGTLKLALADPAPLVSQFGADGLWLPQLEGNAQLEFDGASSITLSSIAGTSSGRSFSGQLTFRKASDSGRVAGQLTITETDLGGIVKTLAGPASLLESGGIWPDGPLATGTSPRTTTGRVAIEIPSLAVADRTITNARFDLDWDATNARIRDFSGRIGEGALTLDATLCCAGPLPDKQLTGRIGITQAALKDLVPAAIAEALDGKLNASGRFASTSGSIAGLFATLTGEGSYTVDNLTISRLDPTAISEVAALDSVLEQQPDQLTALIVDRLDDAPLSAPQVTGTFTIAGGTVRSPNLTVSGASGTLFGNLQTRLQDLGLTGRFSVTPAATVASLIEASTAQIRANLGGTLTVPTVQYDVSGLVDAIMVKAYEAEVDRLEKLRAEDEARLRAEAEEKARAEAEAKAAAEAAARAAEEEAARKAADEAAAKAAEEAAARRAEQEALRRAQELLNQPLDLFGN